MNMGPFYFKTRRKADMFSCACVVKYWLLLLVICSNLYDGYASVIQDPNVCGRPICRESRKFKYQPGVIYDYKYSANIRTLFEGTSKNESTLHVQGLVTMEFITACEGVMEMKQISLTELSPEESSTETPELSQSYSFSKAATQYPLRFFFDDGQITELCPDIQEVNWVLNLKRGILSSFHNSMSRFDVPFEGPEADVNGVCKTRYELDTVENTSFTIVKTKNMSLCENRYKLVSVLQTTPYVFRKNYQALPIMLSTSHCRISIDHSLYSKVECEEEHVLQPFSAPGKGAMTHTSQSLILTAERNSTEKKGNIVMKRTNLLYDHNETPKPTSGELRTARDLLKSMCALTVDDIEPEFPNVFTNFIHTARLLSYTALSQLHQRANGICPTARKHFVDSLPLLQTNPAIAVMRDIIMKNGVTNDHISEWLFTMSFYPRPDLTTIKLMVAILMTAKSNYNQHMLTLSSVVHTYCQQHKNCEDVPDIRDIVTLFAKELETYRNGTHVKGSQEKAVVALKALANIGIATDGLRKSLQECIQNETFPIELRVSAIEAHRRMPCEKHQQYFLKLFRDQEIDTELRIAAYLEVMKCPDYNVIKIIKHSLREENVNQVGSFVWSHLENLRHSSIPSRVHIQGLLQDKDLESKFSQDFRKFSHNFEGSVFFDEYNIGGSYETNMILSEKSYIPRSGMLNLTIDLFGESINVFEMTGRMQGFEHYIESFFGPNGPLNSKKVKEHVSKYRMARSPQKKIVNEVENLPNVIDNNFKKPEVSFGMKMFGNEFSYKSFVGQLEISGALQHINPFDRIKKMLSGQEINYNKTTLFLDTSYIVPTGLGLPLRLEAVGTAAVNLKLAGHLNIQNIESIENFRSQGILDIAGKIRPSVSVNILGTMGVDAYYAKTGIKLKTNLYSSAAVDGQLNIKGTDLVRLTFEIPKNKTEVITAESELIVIHNEKEELQAGVPEGRFKKNICTWSSVHEILGLKFCTEFDYPNTSIIFNSSNFILSGPTKFGMSLQKADPTAKIYLLEYKMERAENTSLISFVFDTPGSVMKKEISATINLDLYSQNLTLVLNAGNTSYEAHGKYMNTDDEKYFTLNINTNGDKLFDAEMSLKRLEGKHGYNYHPRLYVAIKNERVLKLSGAFKWAEKKGVKQYDVDMDFDTKKLSTKFFGYLIETTASFSYNLKLDYKFINSSSEHIRLKAELNNRSSRSLIEYLGNFQFQTSAYPHFDTESKMKYHKTDVHTDCKIDAVVGTSYQDERNKLTMQSVFQYFKTLEGSKLNTSLSMKKPINNIDICLGLNYQSTASDVVIQSRIKYSETKEILISLDVTYPRGTLTYFQIHLNISVPSMYPLVAGIKIHEKNHNEFDIEIVGMWFSGHNFTAKGLYQDKSTAIAIGHNLKLQIKSPSFNEIVVSCKFVNNDVELKFDFLANHLQDEYALTLAYVTPSSVIIDSYLELRYKKKMYSLSSLMNFDGKNEIHLELHLDNYRDIHITLKGLRQPAQKEAAIEVKWDANRDPDQKFTAAVDFKRPEVLSYTGGFLLSFPSRTVNGNFEFAIKDAYKKYISAASLSWNPDSEIRASVIADYEFDPSWKVNIQSELLTPFDSWKRTSVSGRFLCEGDSVAASANMHWHDKENIAVNIFSKYHLSSVEFLGEFNTSLKSTIPQIPSMSASFFHSQKQQNYKTNLYLQYKPEHVISLQSLWGIVKTELITNTTGSVLLMTPFSGYQKSNMKCIVSVTKEMDILGATELDIDRKKYVVSVEGHIKHLTNSMIEINMTTPIKNYTTINAKLGYSEASRHFIALITMPDRLYGVEILLNTVNFPLFDVVVTVGTPFDFLKHALLVMKLSEDMVEFRAGWDVFVVGFTGKWHYVSLLDFDYSYKIYTFIPGFEYSGITAKLLYEDIQCVDVEFSVEVLETKLGLKAEGHQKPPIFRDLPQVPSSRRENDEEEDVEYNDNENENEDYDNAISWKGLVELDTVLYPTMKLNVEIDEKEPIYVLFASLTLPDGVAELYDEFEFIDYFTMSNNLLLSTPCPCFKDMQLIYKFELLPDEKTEMTYDISVLTYNERKKAGLKYLSVSSIIEDENINDNVATVNIYTPFETLPSLEIGWQHYISQNKHKANLTIITRESNMVVAGNMQIEPGFIDLSFGIKLKSSMLEIPHVTISMLQSLVGPEKRAYIIIDPQALHIKQFRLEGVWRYEVGKYLKVIGVIETPFQLVSNLSAAVIYDNTSPNDGRSLNFNASYSDHYVNCAALWNKGTFNAAIETSLKDYRKCYMSGNVIDHNNGTMSYKTILKSDNKDYHVTGTTEASKNISFKAHLILLPMNGGDETIFDCVISEEDENYHTSFSLSSGDEYASAVIGLYSNPVLKYELDLHVDTISYDIPLRSLKGSIIIQSAGNVSAELIATKVGNSEDLLLVGRYIISPKTGIIKSVVNSEEFKGNFELNWIWKAMEDMAVNAVMWYNNPDGKKHASTIIFYKNPRKSFKNLTTGIDINFNNKEWMFGTNLTMYMPVNNDITVAVNLELPPPYQELHSLQGNLLYDKNSLRHLLKLSSQRAQSLYSSSGEGSMTDSTINGNWKFEWGKNPTRVVNNIVDIKYNMEQSLYDISYFLKTPHYSEDTFVTKLSYEYILQWHKIKAVIHKPASSVISQVDIDYQSLKNANGRIFTNTPIKTLSFIEAVFKIASNATEDVRRVEIIWPNNTALLDSKCDYKLDYSAGIMLINGSVLLELPITTRHIGKTTYEYKMDSPGHTTGHSCVEYNDVVWVQGKYKCDSKEYAGFSEDIVNIEVENRILPVGIHYIKQFEYSGGTDGTNLPTTKTQKGEIFQLYNRTISLKGEMVVKDKFTGKDVYLSVTHGNRTIQLRNDYDYLDDEYKQKFHLEFDPEIWVDFNFTLFNKTTDDKKEEEFEINFAYPKKDLTLKGSYKHEPDALSTEASLLWDKTKQLKTVGGSVNWKRDADEPSEEHAEIIIRHPSLKKDIKLEANYILVNTTYIRLHSNIEYAKDPNKKLTLHAQLLKEMDNDNKKKYSYEILSLHPSTRLDMKIQGYISYNKLIYEVKNSAHYKRTYLPMQRGEINADLNLISKDLYFEKKSDREHSYLKGNIVTNRPRYIVTTEVRNGSSESHAQGRLYVNIEEHLLLGNMNFTDVTSHSLHMYGKVPDARNVMFNVWQDYEDVQISDVSFYLRLNHSRLLMSKLKWRPELINDIKTEIQDTYNALWNSFTESCEYWRVYVKSETVAAVNDIWKDAKANMKDVLRDIGELHVMVEHFEEFKLFLNKSYNANEFRIRDLISMVSFVIDELSIRGHIDSFPEILNEMWGVMGESGDKIKMSALWIMQTIETSYNKIVQFINGLFNGDSAVKISELFESLGQKYEKYVKDLHLSFMRSAERFYIQVISSFEEQMNTLIQAVEPTFIELIHYIEANALKFSNELVDFLYERKNDIIRSPFFLRFSNVTHDIDRLYRDFMKNDTLTNIKKYSLMIYEFLKEKYFSMVPFGAELYNVVTEIIEEFKELQNLRSVKFIIAKSTEVYENVIWFYEYYDLGNKIQTTVKLIHLKMTDMAQTALQAENRYREAKTKFIYDPENGVVELEGKLPMSWHALNETPKFEEINEYQMVHKTMNYFSKSNVTFWKLYHDYKQLTEPSNWLPPFQAQAIIAGPQHFMTFDNTFFEYRGTCSYLLATDFIDRNFTFLINYEMENSKSGLYEIILVIKKHIVFINLFQDSLIIDDEVKQLPCQIENVYIYQEASMLYIDNNEGLLLECNLKFDVCSVTISGWYFGKTAGLFGTMDNEPSTDFLTSRKLKSTELEIFAHSWAVNPDECSSTENLAIEPDVPDTAIVNACEIFFKTEASPFSTCFRVVDPLPYMKMCINSNTTSEHDICASAIAYMQTCLLQHIPLRIPDTCVKCHLVDGTEYAEGQFVNLEKEMVPRSTDVVFIVEAKDCNKDIINNKNIAYFLSVLHKELKNENIVDNRYSLVVFGGDGIYDQPRSIVLENKVFAEHYDIHRYFQYISVGNGNQDIFGAIRYASTLLFRAGVSKTMILLPCSKCDPRNMTLDYSVIHHLLVENHITLHVLMNETFILEKNRVKPALFGIDAKKAYLKRDSKVFTGSPEIKRQVKMPKSLLGYCTPLALESNGTIFSALKLQSAKRNIVKRFSMVLAKRIALTAVPSECQTCECTADNNGMSYMECLPCDYPSAGYIDYDFGDDVDPDEMILDDEEDDTDNERK